MVKLLRGRRDRITEESGLYSSLSLHWSDSMGRASYHPVTTGTHERLLIPILRGTCLVYSRLIPNRLHQMDHHRHFRMLSPCLCWIELDSDLVATVPIQEFSLEGVYRNHSISLTLYEINLLVRMDSIFYFKFMYN